MELERERGITIKAQAVRVLYEARDGQTYQLQLIDTPGHVDFTYEVSRSLAACEGALLVVDASQGVEAQTVANTYLAIDAGLELIPCLNKIDLPGAMPDEVAAEVGELIGDDPGGVRRISAKTGEGVADVLEELVARVPAPDGDSDAPPRALIFDSEFDQYRGVIAYIRMVDGSFAKGDAIRAMQAGTEADIDDIGFFTPRMTPADRLSAGEDYPDLRDAIEKLHLNDASFTFEPESSVALGFGFRCGFLGLLHMEIVQERLEREFALDLIASAPSVEYEVLRIAGKGVVRVDNPAQLPPVGDIEEIREPWVQLSVVTPATYIGPLMELSTNRRGTFVGLEYIDPVRVLMRFELPLAELIVDYYDQLKTRTAGYASMDYEEIGYRPGNLVKLDVLVAGEPVDALSMIVHRDEAASRGRTLAARLKELIPRQMFEVPIQAAIGGAVIARETVRALRKNVLAKCYGGDITRKRKLLEKQKEGKRRMKRVGSVEIPQEAFLAMLRTDEA